MKNLLVETVKRRIKLLKKIRKPLRQDELLPRGPRMGPVTVGLYSGRTYNLPPPDIRE